MNDTVWIIGASHGIGAALARHPGLQRHRRVLSGRSGDALEALASATGAVALPLDVADGEAVAVAAKQVFGDAPGRVRVWNLAATYHPAPLRDMDPAQARQMLDVNLLGTLNMVHATLPLFRQYGSGQLALCGSVAGYRGLPNGQPYSCTKAAVISLCESLKAEEPWLDVRVINPGFVKTRMTDMNPFPMPFLQTPEQAADAIVKGLLHRRGFEVHFPWQLTLGLKLLRLLPNAVFLKVAGRLAERR